jgi:hypothetical protein
MIMERWSRLGVFRVNRQCCFEFNRSSARTPFSLRIPDTLPSVA